jgi:hypothetical protein
VYYGYVISVTQALLRDPTAYQATSHSISGVKSKVSRILTDNHNPYMFGVIQDRNNLSFIEYKFFSPYHSNNGIWRPFR